MVRPLSAGFENDAQVVFEYPWLAGILANAIPADIIDFWRSGGVADAG